MAEQSKSIFQSKIVWLNIGIVAIAGLWSNLAPYLPISGPEAAAVGVVANMILRIFFTSQPVHLT